MLQTYIVGSTNRDLSTINKILKSHSIELLSANFESGKSIFESAENKIKNSDFIIAIIDSNTTKDEFFESGFAHGNNKPVLYLVDPELNVPLSISQFMYVRSTIKDAEAIEFNLSIFIKKIKISPKERKEPISNRKNKQNKLFNISKMVNYAYGLETEAQVVKYLHDLLEKIEGINAIYEYKNQSIVADLAIWINDIQKTYKGPILIEYKNYLNQSRNKIQNELNKIHSLLHQNNAAIGFIITKEKIPENIILNYMAPVVIILSLEEFIEIIANNAITKTIIEHRNRIAHSGGSNA